MFLNFITDKIYLVNALSLLVILTDIDIIVKIVVGMVVIGYTSLKIYQMIKEEIIKWKLDLIEKEKDKLKLAEIEQELRELKKITNKDSE